MQAPIRIEEGNHAGRQEMTCCTALRHNYWQSLPSPNPVSGLYRNMISGFVDELPAGASRALTLKEADKRDKL